LVQADRHIAQAEAHIARQLELIRTMSRRGHDTTVAEAMLQTVRETRGLMQDHRRRILAALAGPL
jgi:hypothetical protein